MLVNSGLTLIIDGIAGGLYAIIGSTAGIVVFGEIVPQSICSRYGLLVGAKTLPITLFFMILTYPAAKPISMVLDYILGHEVRSCHVQKNSFKDCLNLNNQFNPGHMNIGSVLHLLAYSCHSLVDLESYSNASLLLATRLVLCSTASTWYIFSG